MVYMGPSKSFETPRLMKLAKDVEEAKLTNQFLRVLLENTLRTFQFVDRGGAGVDKNVYNQTHSGLQQRIATLEREVTYWKEEYDSRQALYIEEEAKASGQRSFSTREEAERYIGKGEKVGRAAGRIAGRGLSAIGSRLQALETMPRRLPTFNSGGIEWTVDERLREFRSFVYGKGQRTVPFNSPLGQKMLDAYNNTTTRAGAGEMDTRRWR